MPGAGLDPTSTSSRRSSTSTASCRSSSSTAACWHRRRTRSCRCSNGSSSSRSRARNLDEFFEIRVAGLKQRQRARITRRRARTAWTSTTSCGRSAASVGRAGGRAVRAAQRRDAPGARTRPASASASLRLDADEQRDWLRELLRQGGRARPDAARSRPGAAVPAHPEQEPQLHRRARGHGRLRPRWRRSRSCRCRARCRGSSGYPVCRRRRSTSCSCRRSSRRSSNSFSPAWRSQGCYQFRVTRNSDLFVDDEEVEDLMRAVQGELASRRYGDAVRLETLRGLPGRRHGTSCSSASSSHRRTTTRSTGRSTSTA